MENSNIEDGSFSFSKTSSFPRNFLINSNKNDTLSELSQSTWANQPFINNNFFNGEHVNHQSDFQYSGIETFDESFVEEDQTGFGERISRRQPEKLSTFDDASDFYCSSFDSIFSTNLHKDANSHMVQNYAEEERKPPQFNRELVINLIVALLHMNSEAFFLSYNSENPSIKEQQAVKDFIKTFIISPKSQQKSGINQLDFSFCSADKIAQKLFEDKKAFNHQRKNTMMRSIIPIILKHFLNVNCPKLFISKGHVIRNHELNKAKAISVLKHYNLVPEVAQLVKSTVMFNKVFESLFNENLRRKVEDWLTSWLCIGKAKKVDKRFGLLPFDVETARKYMDKLLNKE